MSPIGFDKEIILITQLIKNKNTVVKSLFDFNKVNPINISIIEIEEKCMEVYANLVTAKGRELQHLQIKKSELHYAMEDLIDKLETLTSEAYGNSNLN